MVRFEVHRDAMRLKDTSSYICDLHPEALLYRKALGEQPNQARELGRTNDVFVRDVANIGLPIER